MPLNVLFAGPEDQWLDYADPLARAFEKIGIDANASPDMVPEEVDYIVYSPDGPVSDFSPYKNAKAILSLWAGVEKIVGNSTISIPLARMADAGLREGMAEWVLGHVLRYHLGIDQHVIAAPGAWRPHLLAPLARNRRVTVLGLGALGAACATAMARLNFQVTGWSRSPKEIENVRCLSGLTGLREALADAEIVVLLLPDTADTKDILNDRSLAWLPKGARVINPGRGALIDDDALLRALDSGQVGHATLDVFKTEPLPAGHRYWTHPNVTVTPHIASATRPETASEFVAQNIKRFENGDGLVALVDREQGY